MKQLPDSRNEESQVQGSVEYVPTENQSSPEAFLSSRLFSNNGITMEQSFKKNVVRRNRKPH